MTDIDDTPNRLGRGVNRDPAFDAALGARVRAARVAAKLSQGALGEAVGVSFQQVQKYELGKDRVTASTLAAIAAVVGVHPGSFYDDGTPIPAPRPDPRGTLADLRSAQRIGDRVERLKNLTVVRRLLSLVDALVEAQDGKAGGAANGNGHMPDLEEGDEAI